MIEEPKNPEEFQERYENTKEIIEKLDEMGKRERIGEEVEDIQGYTEHGLRAHVPYDKKKEIEGPFCGVYLDRLPGQDRLNSELEDAPREIDGIEIRYFSRANGEEIEVE